VAITYSSYLKVDELLQLQQPLSDGPEHDEMLFIIIHQVYELWFKQVMHEVDQLSAALARHDTAVSLHTFKRILTILKTMVSQVDILETMTPISFSSFRTRLESSSGFQSYQFREFEFALGHRRKAMIEFHPEGSDARSRLLKRASQPSLYDVFLEYLRGSGYAIPEETPADPYTPRPASPAIQEILIHIYRTDPVTTQICERLVDLDEGIQEWRYRHVKMVERTIGTKPGTGGSAGAGYLKSTLFHPLFPDLWAIRASL
jgi:tryptophan 2,3-dioxygenase